MNRAMLSMGGFFEPFHVEQIITLRQAIANGRVRLSKTPLLVRPHRKRPLAFLAHQLAYHNVAYGELEGEPWLVSF